MRHMKNVFIHLFISIYRLSAVGKYLYERSAFCASCQFELLTAQPSRIVQSLPMKSRKTVSSIGDVFDTAATEYRLLGTNWQRSRCRVFAKYQRRFVSDQQAQTSSGKPGLLCDFGRKHRQAANKDQSNANGCHH